MRKDACTVALRRFPSRQGRPTHINTDNGSIFLGAKSELLAIQTVLKANHADSLQAEATGFKNLWKVTTLRTPHFSGLWESTIKRAKRHI